MAHHGPLPRPQPFQYRPSFESRPSITRRSSYDRQRPDSNQPQIYNRASFSARRHSQFQQSSSISPRSSSVPHTRPVPWEDPAMHHVYYAQADWAQAVRQQYVFDFYNALMVLMNLFWFVHLMLFGNSPWPSHFKLMLSVAAMHGIVVTAQYWWKRFGALRWQGGQ